MRPFEVLAKSPHLRKVTLLIGGKNPQRAIPRVGVDRELLPAEREVGADILNRPEEATPAGKRNTGQSGKVTAKATI